MQWQSPNCEQKIAESSAIDDEGVGVARVWGGVVPLLENLPVNTTLWFKKKRANFGGL